MLRLYRITASVRRKQTGRLLICRLVVLRLVKYSQIYLRRTLQLAFKISITNGRKIRGSCLVGSPLYRHCLRLLANTKAIILNLNTTSRIRKTVAITLNTYSLLI